MEGQHDFSRNLAMSEPARELAAAAAAVPFSHHAIARCRTRGIPAAGIVAALDYGSCDADGDAEVYTLGWRQVAFARTKLGVDLRRWRDIIVVCDRRGLVITAYRRKANAGLRRR